MQRITNGECTESSQNRIALIAGDWLCRWYADTHSEPMKSQYSQNHVSSSMITLMGRHNRNQFAKLMLLQSG